VARIYAVGVGPGDPELLTRKAERILRQVPVICAPAASAGDSSHALAIVEPFLDRSRQEVIVSIFPMKKDQEGLDEFWEDAAETMVSHIRQGHRPVGVSECLNVYGKSWYAHKNLFNLQDNSVKYGLRIQG